VCQSGRSRRLIEREEMAKDFTVSRRSILRGAAVVGAGVLAVGLESWPDARVQPEPATADEALKRLLDGNRRFTQGKVTAANRDLARLKAVAAKQAPFAAVLSCADSRVPVEIVFDQGFGDVFVVGVAGNVAAAEEIASLEFATLMLGAKVLIVLGHSGCGAVNAALEGADMPGQISTLYRLIVPGIDRQNKDLDAAIASNVRAQAGVLHKGSTVLAALIKDGKLKLAGGVYDLTSGKVTIIEV
jgi:carbonic anhydrase